MAHLTKDAQRNQKLHTPQLVALPVKAGTVHYKGAIAAVEAATGLSVRGSDTAGLTVMGIVFEPFDNSAGANGSVAASADMFEAERFVRVDQVGEYELAVSGPTPPKPGQDAYVVDDNTVSTVTVNSIRLGRFTRPGNVGGWFVDVGR